MSEKLLTDPRSPQGLEAAFSDVRKRLAAASGEGACGTGKITLLAATKTVPADCINYAIDHLGLTDIGENRVQELLEKYDELHKDGVRIHFIGRLQTNKVKYIADKVCMIHSLDSTALAREIEKQCAKRDRVMDVLVEINLAGEASKGGIEPEGAEEFLRSLSEYPHLRTRGIMVIPPAAGNSEENIRYFTRAKEIFDGLSEAGLFAPDLPAVLSMGMSDSFEEAASCGSTLVRVGSALFGKRDYPIVPEK